MRIARVKQKEETNTRIKVVRKDTHTDMIHTHDINICCIVFFSSHNLISLNIKVTATKYLSRFGNLNINKQMT